MDEIIVNPEHIKSKVASSVIALFIRRLAFQLIVTTSSILLARTLSPEIFGTFGIISFFILTFGIITNFGLGPSLIQHKEKITEEDMHTIFSYPIILSIIFSIVLYFLAPLIDQIYNGQLGKDGVFWFRIYSLYPFFSNLALVSSSMLERKLDYKKFSIGEISTLFITNATTLFLAYKGYGIGAFVIGSLFGTFSSAIFYYILSPWKVRINFFPKNIKKYLHFGINYQSSTLVGSLTNATIPLFVGTYSGPQAVGYINWAQGLKQATLAPSEVFKKILFPATSRSKDNSQLLSSIISRVIIFSCIFSFPLIFILLALSRSVVVLIYTSVWLPALTTLILSLIQAIFYLFASSYQDILFALGDARHARNISLFWAILQWLLTIPLVILIGFNGAIIAAILTNMTFFIPYLLIKKYIRLSILKNIYPYIIFSSISSVSVYLLNKIWTPESIWVLGFQFSSGILIYFLFLLVFKRNDINNDIKLAIKYAIRRV